MSVKKNLVKATTTTAGTGTLTLSPMTGWAPFSVYTNGDVVPYAIENGDNKEVGLGTVGASNTLARTTVLATLVAGTYDDTSPVAITLSGNSTVISGPVAELFDISEIAGAGTAASANTGTSGHVVPYLDGSNFFSANQILQSTDGGGSGPFLVLDHNSPSPAVNDQIAAVLFRGRDSAAQTIDYGSIYVLLDDPAAGSVDGRFGFYIPIANNYAWRLHIGAGVYTPSATGGDKGNGTINAQAVYDDNVLLTCYAIEAYKTGTVTVSYWDSTALDLDVAAQPEQVENRPVTQKVMRARRVRDGARLVETMVEVDEPVYDLLPVVDAAGKPVKDAAGKPVVERVQRMEPVVTAPAQPAGVETRTHAPAARFAARAAELLDPKLYGDSWKATGHLPAMPSPAEWEAAGKKMGLGDIQQRLWETVEVQAIHIDKLLARIEGLETRLTAAGL